ncbi:MAG: FtsW/RodA/SpoVE family cell cycle protein, partial [Candidatus Eremiobacteraeota bacterium]|nr:FtsW/RodA/SpoVE family cell cycle protein [Candidatus Eremiobacteraeota bacterium]
MTLALAIGGFALSLAPRGSIGPLWALVALAAGSYAWVLRSPLDTRRDDVLPALAVLVSALGLATIARLSSALAHKQEVWLAVSLALAIAFAPSFGTFRRFAAYKYVWLLASIVLFALLGIFGQEVNGAKLWFRIGAFQYEPVEAIKLFIVLFMAGYLAETADVLAAAKWWSIRANLKYLGPLFLGWATSMAILVFQRDIGMASLLLVTFVAMLYVATRRVDLIAGGAAIFALAVWFAVRHYPYVIARFAVWRDPFADPLGRGYQALQGLFSLAAGGLLGTGYGLGHPDYIPAVGTDYIFAAWSEEFGAVGGIVLLAAFLTMVVRALGTARA